MFKYILVLAGFFCLYWVGKSKNRLTKFAGLALSLSVLAGFISYGGINEYATYGFAFFTLFAGFEPSGSFIFRPIHKVVFAALSIASFFCLITQIVKLPFNIPFELFLIPAPFFTFWLWKNEKRVVYKRMGFLVIWSTQAVVALFYSEWIRNWLTKLF